MKLERKFNRRGSSSPHIETIKQFLRKTLNMKTSRNVMKTFTKRTRCRFNFTEEIISEADYQGLSVKLIISDYQ